MRAPLRVVASPAAAGLMVLCAAALLGAQYFRPQTATITVTNTNDSGPGSLRQALVDVPDSGTIQFDAALNGQTIGLTSAELVIDKSITINGPGSSMLTIARSSGTFRIFNVMPDRTVTIVGLTITNGNGNGGGVFNDHATLTINGCVIANNAGLNQGGGIYNGSGASLTILNSTVRNNTVTPQQGGGGAAGGGIANNATLTIDNSLITANRASAYWSSGIFLGDGGGIFNNGATASLTITNSIVSNNVAGMGSADMSGDEGGISNSGAAPNMRSKANKNQSFGPPLMPTNGGGGGIDNDNGGTLTMTNTTLSGNSVTFTGGGLSGTGNITDCTISGNQAWGGTGAGISGNPVVTSSTISGNQAWAYGGGIYGSPTITNSTISGNNAQLGGGGIYGGGIIRHCTLSGNTGNPGGGVLATGPVEIANTILKTGATGTNIALNSGGTVTSLGYNLSNDNGTGVLTGPGDRINTDPLIGPLQNNGGPTSTHALLPGSPAINTGNPNFTPPPLFDQRGSAFPRVVGGRLDIGSVEVQPVPTPTPSPTPCLPTITESSNHSITVGNSVSCNDGNTHTDNSYWRAFDMTAYANGGQYCVNSVSFGVEFANTTQPVTVRLYTTSNFPTGFPGSLTQIATTTVNVGSAQNGTVVTTPLVVTAPAGTQQLVMELFTPDGGSGGYRFFVGSNAAMEMAPSYFSAPACGITTPITTAAVGFPNMHIVFDINGNCNCLPTPCPTINIGGAVGQCTISGPFAIAVPGVTITRTSSQGDASTVTNGLGEYSISGVSCVTNTLTPSKAARPTGSSGIDTVDVLAVQRHFLALGTPLTGCRLAAADCAPPVGITTGDVIAIQRYFLFFTTGIGSVGQYNFTPPNRIYSPPVSNQPGQTYATIVFGDVSPPFATP